MRIAFICGFAWEPKGTVRLRAFPIAAELARQGHDVTIFVIPYDNISFSGREWWSEGVHIVNAVVSKWWWFGWVTAVARTIKSVRAFRPDVIHVFKPKGFAGAVAEGLFISGAVPIVVDCDDWEGWGGWNEVKPYPWVVKQFIDWQERNLIKRANAVSVASKVLFVRASEIRKGEAGVAYLPNCISKSQFGAINKARAVERKTLLANLDLPNRDIVLYVGHFEAADDVMFFAQASANAARATGAVIVFVGTGEMLETVQEFFSHRQEIDVRFFGRVNYETYLKLLAASSVVAFPYPDSPVYRAKCSVRMIEFMAMGKPVVSTMVGQNPEYITDRVDGRLCAAGDRSAFEDCLTSLVKNEDEQHRIGENARWRIRESFVWGQKTGEMCEAVYRSVIPSRNLGFQQTAGL